MKRSSRPPNDPSHRLPSLDRRIAAGVDVVETLMTDEERGSIPALLKDIQGRTQNILDSMKRERVAHDAEMERIAHATAGPSDSRRDFRSIRGRLKRIQENIGRLGDRIYEMEIARRREHLERSAAIRNILLGIVIGLLIAALAVDLWAMFQHGSH
jgi:tetrahydromethanopterin S-methyltransferase subunit G